MRGHSASNFKLSPDGGLAHTTLDDHPALKYRWSGLYEADNTVVATADYVFSFAVTYLSAEDPIRRDFESFLQTVDLR